MLMLLFLCLFSLFLKSHIPFFRLFWHANNIKYNIDLLCLLILVSEKGLLDLSEIVSYVPLKDFQM